MQSTDTPVTSIGPIPVLEHDGSRLDWVRAKYTATVTLKHQKSTVIHDLYDAPEIEELLKNGDATFATEIRCPRTMFSRIEQSINNEQLLNLPDTERSDDLFLIPGILIVRDTSLCSRNLHPLIHMGRSSVDIPTGWWLARGGQYRFTPLLVSLLKFFKDKDRRLQPGTMAIEEVEVPDNPYFRVTLAAELYDYSREKRDIQIAALIGAFGLLPKSSMKSGRENCNSPVAQALRSRLKEHDPPLLDWDNDDYDPARAATSLENFWVEIGDDE